jgi:flagellin-like hook-associated protein FlgL
MALTVAHNGAANVATRYLDAADRAASRSLARLSSGTRVLSARDDAASLAIGSRLNVEIAAMRQGAVNARQAVSVLQIADGATAKVGDILTRMKTLSVQSGSGQLSAVERGMLDTEFQALKSEIDRVARDTQFNGQGLVDDGGVVFTLRQLPTNGTVYLDGEALKLNDQFNLSDVQNGRVTYENVSGSSDGLVVSISDKDGYSLGTLTGEVASESFEDSEYLASTGLDNIHASKAYGRGGSGAGVTIAIIDTGVDLYHTDLDDNIVGGVDIVDGVLQGTAITAGTTSGDGNDTNDGNTSDGHGTHVAGIAAGERDGAGTMGVAYEAGILAIKATDPTTGTFNANDLADAIDYARLGGAKVINMSLGFSGVVPIPNQITAAMVRAINAGVVIVAAAGNDALSDPAFPANFAIDATAKGALIAVAATDDQNGIASFSNQAGVTKSFVVTAPGVNIVSDAFNGATAVTSNTTIKSGTSMAAPNVAGAVAVLTQMYGAGTDSDLTGAEIANLVFSTTTDLGTEGIDETYGRGIIDMDKATQTQLRININVAGGSGSTMSDQLVVASGRSAAFADSLFKVAEAYESFSDSPGREMSFKIGSGVEESDDLLINTQSVSTLSLDITDVKITTKSDADDASDRLSAAIDRLSKIRANIGAAQNRLDFAAGNSDTVIENMEKARSDLMDLDVASEMTAFTAKQVLVQSGVAMLSQANRMPQNLLQLFQ